MCVVEFVSSDSRKKCVMKPLQIKTWAFLALTAVCGAARADVITDWNTTASSYIRQHAGFQYSRTLTMLHVAQFDAINAVVGGFEPYALYISAPGASPEAAAAQAAYTILTNISRNDVSTLNSALNRSLTAIPDGQAKEDGIALGRLAANTIIQLRAADNRQLTIPAPTSNALGKWRPAPPNNAPGDGAQYKYFLPWSMRSQAQFRPQPPPPLTSEQYARDVEEVRLIGRRSSTNRTASQTAAANFHFAGDQAFLRPAVVQRTPPLIESARAHALYYMMAEDVSIAFLEAQYAYSLWRPIHAIRLADRDGNDGTNVETDWFPYLETPDHPEYPSGTCAHVSAAIIVLTNFYGNDFSFTSTSGNGSTRRYDRLTDVIGDSVEARIAAGAHYRFSCDEGVQIGQRIAEHALRTVLRPLPYLAAGGVTEDRSFEVHLRPGAALTYVLETSSDLSQWTPWVTNSVDVFLHNDANAAGGNRRFYRALLKP
jgi:hypothetical protein